MVDTCYLTGGLLDALLAIASDREPDAVSTLLLTSPAGELESDPTADAGGGAGDGTDVEGNRGRTANTAVDELDPGTPVFTDLYFPSAGRSVDAVFGVDVSVPHGQAQGRFVSHPLGELSVSKTDDLHEVVVVAVPPWTREIVTATPPEQPFEG
jgi:hypothetical protein